MMSLENKGVGTGEDKEDKGDKGRFLPPPLPDASNSASLHHPITPHSPHTQFQNANIY